MKQSGAWLMMTALEIRTATTNELDAVFFGFHDGELAQISQFQSIPLENETCTITGDLQAEGVAIATGAAYVRMNSDLDVERVLDKRHTVG
jgi:acetolactate synthase-1/2/3 large subunit